MIDQARILIVDDDERIRETLQRALARTDYSCLTAQDTVEAADCLGREEIDLVLLDIHMPGRSGMEFLPTITECYPNVAVVMLTGLDERSTAVWAMREGAYDFCAKPVDFGELIIKTDNALRRLAVVRERNAYQTNLETMLEGLERLEVQSNEMATLLESVGSQMSPDPQGVLDELKAAVRSNATELDRLIRFRKVLDPRDPDQPEED